MAKKPANVPHNHDEPSDGAMPMVNLRHRLVRLGWLESSQWDNDEAFTLAVEAYQAFHALKVDGIAGPVTTRHLTLPRICGVPEYQTNDPRQMRWRSEIAKSLTWHPTAALPGMSLEDTKAVHAESWRRWAAVCGINPRYTPNARTANVIHNVGPIDGRFGTLAWSKLAYLTATSLDQLYDSGEPWVVVLDEQQPVPQGKIEAIAVATHETGHVLGIAHIQSGNLLAPIYSASIRSPRRGDIDQATMRYGKPLDADQPTPGPTPTPIPNPKPDPWNGFSIEIGGGQGLFIPARPQDKVSVSFGAMP